MSGGIYFRFTVGRSGTAAENARYITRLSATGGDEQAIYLHNYPAHISEAKDYDELRQNVIEYNRQREEDELTTKRRGGGKTRTHYRCRFSFEGEVDGERALGLAREFLGKNFPDARAAACVHHDTDHTHVHINLQARLVTGYKLDLGERKFRRLDTAWGAIYAREFGREKLREHELKKEEMREAKREYAQAKERGEEFTGRWPARVERPLRPREHREREARNYGADEARAGRDQRHAAIPTRGNGTEAEREGSRESVADRAARDARAAVHTIERVRGEMERLLERGIGREDYEIER